MTVIRVETLILAPVERCFDLARDVGLHSASVAGTAERLVLRGYLRRLIARRAGYLKGVAEAELRGGG